MISLKALPNQESGEVTVLFLRRYWLDLAGAFFFTLAMTLVPIAVGGAIRLGHLNIMEQPFWGPTLTLLLSCYMLVVAVITMAQITDYFLDVWIVTTERVINIEQHGLFSRTVSELRLNQVQDITSETSGFLGTFLTYGNVFIQTAAERERFQFKNIDNPDDVKLTIAKLVAEAKHRRGDASVINHEEREERVPSDAIPSEPPTSHLT
ncbi:TPA: hypothetical protein DEP96_03945 [Candidatus Uhrbacteria bacterium]|nr:hypothetical protein [Candidatus Uhrbacteria bacterium]